VQLADGYSSVARTAAIAGRASILGALNGAGRQDWFQAGMVSRLRTVLRLAWTFNGRSVVCLQQQGRGRRGTMDKAARFAAHAAYGRLWVVRKHFPW